MKKYPIQRKPAGRGYPIQTFRPQPISIPASIIPKFTKGRDIGGQISTKIHLRNSRGEEMSIYQNQQLLNLSTNGKRKGHWHISDSSGSHHNRKKG